jgi:hypothetical protein
MQVWVANRLGYMNIFNPKRPALHYRLRMWRPDDHEVGYSKMQVSRLHAWHRTQLHSIHPSDFRLIQRHHSSCDEPSEA